MLAKDYETYSSKLNITFVGVSTDVNGNQRSLQADVEKFKLKPFAHVLDNTGALASAYQVPQKVPLTIVIVDAEGKIALNVEWNYRVMAAGSSGKPDYKYITALNGCSEKAPGLLGDLKAPEGCEQAAHMFSLQQFDLMEMEFAKVPQNDGVKAFREGLKAKVEAYTKQRLTDLQAMADTDPLTAYYETQVFVQAFRKAKELSAAQSLLSKLRINATVKKELEAEMMYQRVVAPQMTRINSKAVYEKKIKPLMDAYLQRYGTTKYAIAMKSVHDTMTQAMR
jgi:hypothetical protein